MKTKNETRPRPPGVMLYRSNAEMLDMLPAPDLKRLLLALLCYDGPGTEPAFDDPTLAMAWAAFRERVDADRREYEATCMTNRYHRFLREARIHVPREDCPDYEAWFELSEQGSLSASQTVKKLLREPDGRPWPSTTVNDR